MFSLFSGCAAVGARSLTETSVWTELFEYFKENYFTLHFDEYSNVSVDSSSLGTILICFFIGLNLAALISLFNKRVLGDFVRALIKSDCLSADRAKTLSELGFQKNSAVRGSLRSGVTLRRVVRCAEEEEYYAALAVKRAEYEAVSQDAATATDIRRENDGVSVKDTSSESGGGTITGSENNGETETSAKSESNMEDITNNGTKNNEENVTDEPLDNKSDTVCDDGEVAASDKKKPRFREAEFRLNLETAHFYIPEKLKYTAEIKFEKKGTTPVSFLLVLVLSFVALILLFRYLPDVFYLLDNILGSFKD